MKAITPDAKLIFMVTGPVSHLITSAAAASKTCYAVALYLSLLFGDWPSLDQQLVRLHCALSMVCGVVNS